MQPIRIIPTTTSTPKPQVDLQELARLILPIILEKLQRESEVRP
ncbi:MAG TPA: hypothetical protein VD973_19340 [Symbiobacteriaceae bacterium]|nr:hypothetical protein [Symbiobacteriaceae bacterium]